MPDTDQTSGQPADLASQLSADRRALLTMALSRRRQEAQLARQPRENTTPCFPTSYAQERLWFLDQADPGSAAYVMAGAWRLHGPLDLDALRRALSEILRRHEVLRTVFVDRSGQPVQQICPAQPVSLPVHDLSSAPAKAREAEARISAEAARPFSLATDVMLRAEVLRLDPAEHVLLLSVHHIAADGWSVGVLVRELGALYAAFRLGQPAPLPALAVQYGDYAVWQRSWLADGRLEAQLGYWRDRLRDAAVLELPASSPRDGAASWRGSAVPLDIAAELHTRLTALAGEANSTPYMVLATAFAIVLSRWSGQDDVVIGLPITGRRRAELEPLVGLFVNTLPVRVDTSGMPSFRELLARVRDACHGAYAHQDVPFEKLVQELRPPRSADSMPLVQAMLALRDVPMEQPALASLVVERLAQPVSQHSKFDIVADLVPGPDGGLSGRLEYRTDLVDDATARRMAQAFALVLEAAAGGSGRRASDLVLTAAERDLLLGPLSGQGSAAPARTGPCLHTLIDRRARERPDSPAVYCAGAVLSYRELTARANQLAHRLRALDAGPEQLVGVCLPKSPDMIVAVLGILKAGAAYVPLDPGYPPARVQMMLRDSNAAMVVTSEQIAGTGLLRTRGEDVRLVLLDSEAELAGLPDQPPAELAGPRTLAYVIYTSGSSGVPKGAPNSHAGVRNTLTELSSVLGLSAEDRMLAISSLNYDMSVYEILGTLLAGACVVVPDQGEASDPDRLGALLTNAGVTCWSSAPALLEMLLDHIQDPRAVADSALRLVLLGGDRIPPGLPGRLAGLLPGLRLYNLAGATEVSYCSTCYQVREPEPVPGNIPWGRPLPHQRLYVLDDQGQPVPVGARGELFIGGAGVGRGYWRRPGLTAERFVPDPFGPDPGGRLYRTGDLARWRATGELEFLGRLDAQVKLRGQRIEPGEIEHALSTHPHIRETAVVLRGAGRRLRLVAYVTAAGKEPPDHAELRQHLLKQLPEHMVPSNFVVLDQFPLLPGGKLDRAALPEPASARPERMAYVPPADPVQEVLAGVWADVLDLDRVGMTDDFFELGGHSLLITQAIYQIRETLRVEFSIRAFLTATTVAELAAAVRDEAAAAGVDVSRAAQLTLEVNAMDQAEVAERLSGRPR